MKILACHNFYREDGGENMVFRQEVEILRAHGHAVVEYTRDSADTADDAPAAEKARVFAGGFWSRRTEREVTDLLDRERPDVALVQNVFPLISPSLYQVLAPRVGIVQLVFNYRFLCPDAQLFTEGQVCERCIPGSTLPAVIHKCYRGSAVMSAWYAGIIQLHRFLRTFQMVDRYVVPDRFLATKLVEGGYPQDRMRWNTNPFDLKGFDPQPTPGPYALFVGRWVRQKGVLTLIEALRQTPDLELVMVGGGEAAAEIRQRVEAYGLAHRVRFPGVVFGDAMKELMRGARFVLVPSEWYDNSPLVLYQAFALAKPVIASKIDGLPEVIEHEKHGLLFEPGDAAGLAACMARLHADPALTERLGRAARARAEAEFGAESHYRRLHDVLAEARRCYSSPR